MAKDKKLGKNPKTGKPINEYKLYAGGHIQADPLWEATEEEKEDAKVRGTSARAPSQTFQAPCTVKSDKDLVAMFPEKFQYISAPQPQHALQEAPAKKGPTTEYEEKVITGVTGGLSVEDLNERIKQEEDTSKKAAEKSEEELEDTPDFKSQDAKQQTIDKSTTEGKSATKHKHK